MFLDNPSELLIIHISRYIPNVQFPCCHRSGTLGSNRGFGDGEESRGAFGGGGLKSGRDAEGGMRRVKGDWSEKLSG